MKERPILFNAEMVRAILDGRKVQTRRDIRPQPTIDRMGNFIWNGWNFGQEIGGKPRSDAIASPLPSGATGKVLCPYGKPGDQLWVRETFQPIFADGFDHDSSPYPNYKTGFGYAISYPATDGIIEFVDGDDNITSRCKPAIHMPRWASRIQLEITGVRVERLNDISTDDIRAEGIVQRFPGVNDQFTPEILKGAFIDLWESINGAGSWQSNPWVWVIEFKRINQ